MTPEEIKRRVEMVKDSVTKRMHLPITVGQLQESGTAFFRVKGDKVWTSQVCLKVGDDLELRRRVLRAICDLCVHDNSFQIAPTSSIKGEWVGSRAVAQCPVPNSVTSEAERFQFLEAATQNPLTILYLHGGGFITGSPSHSRQGFAARITERTGGKCFSLKYRLSPQHIFPTALYDALLAYLSLISPPRDAYHTAIPAKSIVFSGDSSGGNICLSLIQLIQQLRRQNIMVQHNGSDIELAQPAGVSIIGAYTDQTDCMPSWKTTSSDWLFAPKHANTPFFVPDAIWPPSPLRASFYCHNGDLCHPLVSPMGATDWIGCPPLWICVGEEKVADSCKVIAQSAARQGVPVVWRQYSGVPHIWHLLPGLEQLPQTLDCLRSCAHFCNACISSTGTVKAKALALSDPECGVQVLNPVALLNFSSGEIRARMREGASDICRSLTANDTGAPKL